MINNIDKTYDKLSNSYKKDYEQSSPFNTYYERPAMMKLLGKSLYNKEILDAGCAGGWYTEKFISMGANVTAIDVSEEMIKLTKDRVNNKAKVLNIDLNNELPFKENKFDIIVSSLTLHYIEDLKKVFSEFKRTLKPNGILLFSIHHPCKDLRDIKGENYFKTKLYEEMWEKNGIKVKVQFYHRPLQEIVNTTIRYFNLEYLLEPIPEENFKEKDLDNYNYLIKNPHFLIIKALNSKCL